MPTEEDVLRLLRANFGTRYEESYEHGKREFADAVTRQLNVEAADAAAIVDRLEEAQTIRFHKAADGHEAAGPRVGLFDEPGAGPHQDYEPAQAGHYWELAPEVEEDLPGTA